MIARRYQIFLFIDHEDNVIDVLAKTNFLILPSYREGMPRSALEASAMGIHVWSLMCRVAEM